MKEHYGLVKNEQLLRVPASGEDGERPVLDAIHVGQDRCTTTETLVGVLLAVELFRHLRNAAP